MRSEGMLADARGRSFDAAADEEFARGETCPHAAVTAASTTADAAHLLGVNLHNLAITFEEVLCTQLLYQLSPKLPFTGRLPVQAPIDRLQYV